MEPMDDFAFGTVLGTLDALNAANARAAEWERYAHEVEANRDLWMSHAQKLESEAKDLADKLAVEQAHSGGLKAVVDAFKSAHPDSPLLEPTANAFTSPDVRGILKRGYHLEYERAFDAQARKNGIANPASRRYD